MADLDFDTALQKLRLNARNPEVEAEGITSLGTASSQSSNVRERLAEPEMLQALLGLLDASLTSLQPAPTTLDTLRCIGNASINNDAARQIITDHGFVWTQKVFATEQLDTGLKVMAFNSLHNICLDFEPAQKRCYAEHVHEDVLRCYFDICKYPEGQDRISTSMFADFLLSLCGKREKGDELGHDISRKHLLTFPHVLHDRQHQVDDFATATEIALIYVRDEGEQAKIVESALVQKVWQILEDCEDLIAKQQNEEDRNLLVAQSTSLTWCLSDIAARPEFANHYSGRINFLYGKVVGAIKRYSTTAAMSERLVSAACQVYGNLLWLLTDPAAGSSRLDVLDARLHSTLMGLTTVSHDAETLYSMTGLLIQMSRYSEEYKARLSDDERLPHVLKVLCESESKEVRQGGMKLLQLLGKDNTAIRERYSGLAAQVMQSLVPEQDGIAEPQRQNSSSVVELRN